MATVRLESVSGPIATPEVLEALTKLLVRMEPMGLLPHLKQPLTLDLELVRVLARALADRGIARASLAAVLAPGFRDPALLQGALEVAVRDLEASPVPQTEWGALVDILEPELLGSLVGVSPSSSRRYASGARKTPDDVAERLHFVALIVGELAGAYNDIGIRRWFARPRSALGGKKPAALLARHWTPDDEGPKRVRELASSLAGSPAT
ncbi:MAG: hypothetical protein WEB06_16155 [Actinomycetota bacterium]